MLVKVAINGFGRIGRMVLRSIVENNRKDIEVVAINNKGNAEVSSFLLKHDTIHGKLKAKAFPGRAAILIKLLDLSNNEIEAVYEKPGSPKINNYVPGTKIPIKSDRELNLKELDVIIHE